MIIQLVNKTKLCLFIIDKLVVLVNIDIIKHQKKKNKIKRDSGFLEQNKYFDNLKCIVLAILSKILELL